MLSQRILECEANVALLHSFLESRSALARHLESHELPRTIEPGLNTTRDPSQSLISLYSNRKTRIRKWTNIIKRVKVYQTINKNLVDTTTAKQQIVFCHGKKQFFSDKPLAIWVAHATGYPSCEVKRLLYQGLYINILGDPGADSGVEGRLDFPLPLLSAPGSPRMIRSQPILILSKRQEHINVSH